jgi:SAM-dependent methyltransferase
MPLDAKKNEPTPYSSVVRCERCGLGSLSPLPEADEIPAFYALDRYYTHGESHISAVPPSLLDKALTKLAWWADHSEPFDPARIAVSLSPGARICDLGCGHAQYLQTFKALGFEVVGVDPDPSARAQAAQAGVMVLEGTAEDVPDMGRQFDLVLMTHSLEHCRDPERALANAARLTKPGGLCYIEVPNCACEHFETFTICSEMFDAPRHIHFFTPAALEEGCRRAGLSIKKRLFSGYVRDFGTGWRGWEKDIADRVNNLDPSLKAKRHSFAASVGLLLRSFWRSPERKYDCVGLLLTKAS